MKAKEIVGVMTMSILRETIAGRKIKSRIFIAFLTVLIVGVWARPPLAQQSGIKLPSSSSGQGEKILKLGLKEAVGISLLNNLDIAAEKFNPQIAETVLARAKSEFHPVIFGGVDAERKVRPSGSSVFSVEAVNNEFNFNAGLKSKFITGGSAEIRYDSSRDNTNSLSATLAPSFTTDVSLIVTQPLLRDYGITINRSSIIISENEREIARTELASKVNDIVAQTEVAYWELVSSIEILKVRQRSLDLAKELLRKNQIKVEVGVLAPVEILQAEAVVAGRKEDIITARVAIEDAEDSLRRIMNPREYKDMWRLKIEPRDEPPFLEYHPSLEDMLREAFSKRYDYNEAILDLKNRGIRVKVAKNGMLPRVDLVGSLGLNGLSGESTGLPISPFDGGYGDSLDTLTSGDYYSWQVGVTVEYPLGNVSQRSEFTRRKLEEQQAQTQLRNLELVVQEQVRRAVRSLEGNLERVKATRVASSLARERLEAEESKFEVGISTNFEVLELQEDLAIAENNAVRAIIDYYESQVELLRTTATLLESRRIKID